MPSSPGRREFWERVVHNQQQSGLNGRAWCQTNGVALASFYIWRKKLAPAASAGSDIQWLPLEPGKSTSCAAGPSGLTLRVGAVSVEIATGFDTSTLSDVLTILESRC